MGHIHLVNLPSSRKWRDVVELLTEGASDAAVVAQSARAAEKDILGASSDPVFVESVRLLLSIPLAARADDFGAALREAGMDIAGAPGLFDIIAAAADRLDHVAGASPGRTDLGEISGRSLSAVLATAIGDQLPGLFEETPGEVQAATRKLSWSRGIAELTRGYFGHLLAECLSSWLDRTLASQIGAAARYRTVADRTAFDASLEQYSSEATRIIQEFSGGWYGKTVHDKGRIDSGEAARFGAVALRKIVEELRVKQGSDV